MIRKIPMFLELTQCKGRNERCSVFNYKIRGCIIQYIVSGVSCYVMTGNEQNTILEPYSLKVLGLEV